MCFGLAAANIENAVVDKESDKKITGKRDRPLPTGLISETSAGIAAYSLYLVTMLTSLLLNIPAVLATIFIVCVVHTYNVSGRRDFEIFGHMLAALSLTSCIIIPSFYSGNFSLSLFAIALFLLDTGRSMIYSCADFEDTTGSDGYKTVPSQIGIRKTLTLSYCYTIPAVFIFLLGVTMNHYLGLLCYLAGMLWMSAQLFVIMPYIFEGLEHLFPKTTVFEMSIRLSMAIFMAILILSYYL
jgi:4-hydroxybenzoate polyprenyltransferase